MSQQDIYDYMKLHRKVWFSNRALHDKMAKKNIEVSKASVSAATKKLREKGFIDSKETRRDIRKKHIIIYKFKEVI
jgi:Mn-dependent DtxR family transcriptional regulator